MSIHPSYISIFTSKCKTKYVLVHLQNIAQQSLKIAPTCLQRWRVSPTMLGGWLTKDQICVFPSGRYLLNMIDKGNLTRTTLLRGYTPSDQIYQNHNPNVSASQGGFNFSSLPAGLGRNGEFERRFEEIWEEIIQNEVSLGASPTIKVTLLYNNQEVEQLIFDSSNNFVRLTSHFHISNSLRATFLS